MVQLDIQRGQLQGDAGTLDVPPNDEITRKLAMLIEGQCEGLGPKKAAEQFGYSEQPICFTTATAARKVSEATPELLPLAAEILGTAAGEALVLADSEYFASDVLDYVAGQTPFELLVPMSQSQSIQRQMASIPAEEFQRHWVGYATAKRRYTPRRSQQGPFWQFIQREGERRVDDSYKGFLSTTDSEAAELLSGQFPKRWHIEEFYNRDQSLGWQRAGTQNGHIRYGQRSLALIAQTLIHQLRQRLGEPYATWDASHLAKSILNGLDGDVRVRDETILVTLYNVPEAERFRVQYEDLPARLTAEGLDPRIPWLYNFQLDFRFR